MAFSIRDDRDVARQRSTAARAPELRANLRRVYTDAIAFSLMVGAGETYLAAFVLAMGKGELAAGLVASVPMLAGAMLQLVSPSAVRMLGSHKKWVVICAAAQASAFVPLVAAAVVGRIHLAAVFAIASLYWAAGLATGPAWNTWVGTLVPPGLRARFFASRSRAAHFAVLVGLLGAGVTLQLAAQAGDALQAFAVIFGLASVCRITSAALLWRHSEPEPPDEEHRVVPMRDLLARATQTHDGRLLAFMIVMQSAVQISGPYFTPYMLGEIRLSYGQYLLLIATSYSARIVVMPIIGGWVRRAGPHRVLWCAGVSLVPLSALWIVSDSLAWLLAVQVAAGACWAAYELATFLLLFETIAEEERTSVLTTFNLANALAMVTGSAVGGSLLHMLGSGHAAYMVIFGLSGVVRLASLLMLRRAVRGIPQQTLPTRLEVVPTRILAVRPNLGAIEKPILPALPESGGDDSLPQQPQAQLLTPRR